MDDFPILEVARSKSMGANCEYLERGSVGGSPLRAPVPIRMNMFLNWSNNKGNCSDGQTSPSSRARSDISMFDRSCDSFDAREGSNSTGRGSIPLFGASSPAKCAASASRESLLSETLESDRMENNQNPLERDSLFNSQVSGLSMMDPDDICKQIEQECEQWQME